MGGGFADQLLALSYLRVAASRLQGFSAPNRGPDACGVSNRLPEGSGCGLQAVAYFPKLLRCDVDALLLGVCALALAFSSLAESFQLRFHLLDRPGEVCQLGCNARYVFLCGRGGLILCRQIGRSRPDRDRLDLDQDVVAEKCADLDERARGRMFRVDIFVADCAHGGDLADVAQEVGQLDDVAPGGIGGLESARQVLEDLARLDFEVALPDEVTLNVERNLPRDVYHPAGRRIDDMAVADGAGQGLRREEASFVHARVDTTSYAGNTKTSEGENEHESQTATSGA